MEDLIIEFLKIPTIEDNSSIGLGYGYGKGDGKGYGYGYGYGKGDGYGYGNGYGYGYGYGSGEGSGNGCGCESIVKFNNHSVYIIDNIPTIITNIKGNIASGFILKEDLTLVNTFIAKVGDFFAHGCTVKEVFKDAQDKYNNHLFVEDKIELFLTTFNTTDKYPASQFFDWHKTLTGSCKQGRLHFMQSNNITFSDEFTVMEFLYLTKYEYNSQIINAIISKIEKDETKNV